MVMAIVTIGYMFYLYPPGAFLILGLASDLLHNHSVVWLMYFLLSDINE